MVALLIFSLALVVAVLISDLTQRSVLSTAALFLFVGFALGRGGLKILNLVPKTRLSSK